MVQKLSTKEILQQNKTRSNLNSFLKTVAIADNIRSMHNIGSMFRTSDALGLRKLFLCGVSPTPPRPEISKSALGSDQFVSWEYFESITECIKELKKMNYAIVGIEQTNCSIELYNFNVETNTKYALVLGNEVNGLSKEILPLCDYFLEIPQFGQKHSFNVSVSFGIVSYTLFERIKKLNHV